MSRISQDAINNADGVTLLTKHLTMMHASTDKRLSAADYAVLLQLMDYYNPSKGYAYPSMDTLAKNTNRARRTIADSIGRLVKLKLLTIVKHGTRNTSNRYAPIWHDYLRPEKPANENPTSMQPTALYTVQSTAIMCAVQHPECVQPTALNLIYEPDHKARVNKEEGVDLVSPKSTTAGAGVALTPCGAANPLAVNVGLKYAEFWNVYPKRRNAKQAESEIDKAIVSGVSLSDIIHGAQMYAKHVAAQSWGDDMKYIKDPTTFIKNEHWLDDWEVKKKPSTNTKTKTASTKPASKALYPEQPSESSEWRTAIILGFDEGKSESGDEIQLIFIFELLGGEGKCWDILTKSRNEEAELIGRQQLEDLFQAAGQYGIKDIDALEGKTVLIQIGNTSGMVLSVTKVSP